MAWGFGTWDANGSDNNTGLVKINAVGIWSNAVNATGSKSFNIPAGYTLDFLVQPAGDFNGSARKKITVSGSTITVAAASSTDFSENTYPNYTSNILAYAR